MTIVEQVEAVVADVIPPAGRANLTNPQKVALGQVVALAHLAEQQRIANLLTVLGGSAGMVEHAAYVRGMTDDGKARVDWRNQLRADVRSALGLDG